MTRMRIYTKLSKESLYCLLIQFSPLKVFLYSQKHTTVEYFNKKDMKYSIEMIKEVKINNRYLKYKILENKEWILNVKTEHSDTLHKFGEVIQKDKEVYIKFRDEKEMKRVYDILKNVYVDNKKLIVNINEEDYFKK